MSDDSVAPIPIISGPTAVGKTAVTIHLARRLSAEIISAESRQVFRLIDIGTAKPTRADRARVPHHFIDELDLDESFSAGVFASSAEDRISQVLSCGRLPIVTGGSMLYLHALIAGLADIPKVSPEIRSRLNERLRNEGPLSLYEELVSVDPDFAGTLDPSKSQRIIRGLEVFYGTNEPLSAHFNTNRKPRFKYSIYILTRDRKKLYADIDQRVRDMVARGLVDEVRRVGESGYGEACNALRTIGYKEVFAHLKGESSVNEMIWLIQRNTRRYAKRQLTWFRKYSHAIWIDMDSHSIVEAGELVADSLAKVGERSIS